MTGVENKLNKFNIQIKTYPSFLFRPLNCALGNSILCVSKMFVLLKTDYVIKNFEKCSMCKMYDDD